MAGPVLSLSLILLSLSLSPRLSVLLSCETNSICGWATTIPKETRGKAKLVSDLPCHRGLLNTREKEEDERERKSPVALQGQKRGMNY